MDVSTMMITSISMVRMVSAEYKTMDGKLTFLGALRLDYQDRIQEVQVSPRAAIVYKPAARHTFRGTYNRAFQRNRRR